MTSAAAPPELGEADLVGEPLAREAVNASADGPARQEVTRRLADSLFVEAGAGSGKTSALVARVVRLICTGSCSLDDLAVITFTEAAAAELRARVRAALAAVVGGNGDAGEAARAKAALDDIDDASIGTIHGYCHRLLTRYPIEAGLPPRLEVMDEVGQSLAWRADWESALDRYSGDADARELFSLAMAIGVTYKHLADLAAAAGREWHRCGTELPDVAAIASAAGSATESAVASMLASIEAAEAFAGACRGPDDYLLARIRRLAQSGSELAAATTTEERLAVVAKAPLAMRRKLGRRENWSCDVELVRRCLAGAAATREALLSQVCDLVLPGLVATFDILARRAAADRCRQGRLIFHDLLVLARDLLVDNPAVRRQVRAEVRHLVIDEVQDTDPLQYEIAALLGTVANEPDEGRLFLVGDPKQSIYSFRGADLDAYETARAGFGESATLRLTSNFRSVPEILDYANACFELLMPSYTRLHPERAGSAQAAAVKMVGGPLDPALRRNEQRSAESQAVAAMIERAVRTERWLVESSGSWRPATLSDVAILVPRRTGLAQIEAALDSSRIGYRVESASLLYRSQEVRDLLALCRAIDEPGSQVSLLAALRSSAFACGDDDLLAYHRSGGQWSIEEPERPLPGAPGALVDSGDPSIVADSIARLGAYRRLGAELGPIGLLEHVVADRRILQMAAGSVRERESWRRVRFLVERARAFVDAGGGGLGEFADWVDEQLAEGLRAVESVLPEPDEDVVHILTVHGAKGLEFPITVLAGFGTTDEWRTSGVSVLRGDGSVEVRLRAGLETSGHRTLKSYDDLREREEAIRLLYVAVTRARDHLVVCAHHVPAKDDASQVPAEVHGLGASLPGFTDKSTLGQRLYEVAVEALATHPELYEVVDPAGDAAQDAGPAARGTGAAAAPEGTAAPARAPAGAPRRTGRRAPGPGQEALFDLEPLTLPSAARRATLVAPVPAKPVAPFKPEVTTPAPVQVPKAMTSLDEYRAWVSRRQALLQRMARPATVHPTDLVETVDGGRRRAEGRHAEAGGTKLGRAVHATLQSLPLMPARRLCDAGAPVEDHETLRSCALSSALDQQIPERADEVAGLARAALLSPSVVAAFQAESPRREVYVATSVGDVVLEGYVDLCAGTGAGLLVVEYKTDVCGDDFAQLAERYSLQVAAYALALSDATGQSVDRCVIVFVAAPDGPREVELTGLPDLLERVRGLVAGG
ncbi:MAG: UvrD-helicase domain-containing protein [Acidimicrobiales bacterium]